MDTLLNPTDQSVIKQQTAINNNYLTAITSGNLCYFLLFLVAHTDPTNIILLFCLWLEIFTLLALAMACTIEVFRGLAAIKAAGYTEDRFIAYYLHQRKTVRLSSLYFSLIAVVNTLPMRPFNQESLAIPTIIFKISLSFIGMMFFLVMGILNTNEEIAKSGLYKTRFPVTINGEFFNLVIASIITFVIFVGILLVRLQLDFHISPIFDNTILITLIFAVAMITLWQLWQLKPNRQTVEQ